MTAITFDIHGIKCDNTACDYADLEAEFDPEKYLNMPCPKCGENLFTGEDYRLMKAMLKVTQITNAIFKDIDLSGHDKISIPIEMDGTGSLKIDNAPHVPRRY